MLLMMMMMMMIMMMIMFAGQVEHHRARDARVLSAVLS